MTQPFFQITHEDPKSSARSGRLRTAHGQIDTPVFMPVGTQGTVKCCSPDELRAVGSQIILGNTYHLYMRPGHAIVERAGGLQKFSNWNGPVLTDSGGFQVYSLADLRKVNSDGVTFKSHLDGSVHHFTPESATDIQMSLGSDIMMAFDECPPYPCTQEYAADSVERTTEWASRCRNKLRNTAPKHGYAQALFAIVQGSIYPELRRRSAEALVAMDFPGYAIGGLSIGEPKPLLFEMVEFCVPFLPALKPRYLMGMGKPEDIVTGIGLGVDMFDCVLPTRNARKGQVFTWDGPMNVKNAFYKADFRPIDENCDCIACRNFTRAYIRHLIHAGEVLGLRLTTMHNLHFYHDLVAVCRREIQNGTFASWSKSFLSTYRHTIQPNVETA